MSFQIEFDWPESFSASDIDEMVELLNVVVETSGTNGFSEPLTRADGEELAKTLEFAIQKDEAAQLLCRNAEGHVVAIGTLLRPKQPDRRHCIEVARVAIHPDYRGNFLLRGWSVVLDRVEQMGADLIGIDVSEDGPIALWEQLGFTTWGVMKDYARVKGRKLDGYYMAVYLDVARQRLQMRGQTPSSAAK